MCRFAKLRSRSALSLSVPTAIPRRCKPPCVLRSPRSTVRWHSRSSPRWIPRSVRRSFSSASQWLTGAFAGIALLLSTVGLYSVLAYAVTQRTNEIGLRMALGAQRQQVIALVLRSGLSLVAFGLVIGLGIAAGAARLIRTLLFSVQPIDPLIYGCVTVLFAFIAILACLLPSLRASRIDPMIALRTE